jgi:hypothetical protein
MRERNRGESVKPPCLEQEIYKRERLKVDGSHIKINLSIDGEKEGRKCSCLWFSTLTLVKDKN